jgi:ribonuclease HII
MRLKNQNNPDILLETVLLQKGYKRIIGIDEAGRGAWAGPVAVGAFIFNIESKTFEGVKDSKLLTSKSREILFQKIFNKQTSIIELGGIDTINKIGIGKTITKVIQKIIEDTYDEETFYLIDGVFSKDFGKNSKKIIKGDQLHYSISCASILAKVYRDRLLTDLSKEYPQYFFDSHKGYGTIKHQEALKIYGISKIHRLNYKPIVKMLNNNAKIK